MKIDIRVKNLLSEEEINNLIGQANKLAANEGKVVHVIVDGYKYNIALTCQEVSAFPLNP